MKDSAKDLTRAAFVQGAIVLPALAGLMFASASPARAGQGSKSQYKYQDKPNGSKKCSNCTFFFPGKTATAEGTCKIVQGSISPSGYCIAWSAKTS